MSKLYVIITVIVVLAGCAPIKETKFQLDDLTPGQGKAMDVRTSPYPWSHPHPLLAWRGTDGATHVVVENASDPGLSVIEDPVNSAVEHFTWGP